MATTEPTEGKKVDKKAASQYVLSFYFGRDQTALVKRVDALVEKLGPQYSRSSIFMTSIMACIETLEKEAPSKREFMLNGKKVRL